MQTLADDDAERIFLDWGVPATLEEIQSYYDPDTGDMEESSTSTAINVIASPVESLHYGRTAAVQREGGVLLLARAIEIPGSVELLTARIVVGEEMFRIESIVASQIPNLLALDCKSISD